LRVLRDRRPRGETGKALMSSRRVRPHPLRARAASRPALLRVLIVRLILGGCKHAASPGDDRPQGSPTSASSPTSADNVEIFDLKMHPNATVIHPIDPHTLSESQLKFGVAPKRDPSVDTNRTSS
jgi:hypothetical protein